MKKNYIEKKKERIFFFKSWFCFLVVDDSGYRQRRQRTWWSKWKNSGFFCLFRYSVNMVYSLTEWNTNTNTHRVCVKKAQTISQKLNNSFLRESRVSCVWIPFIHSFSQSIRSQTNQSVSQLVCFSIQKVIKYSSWFGHR